MGHFDEVIKTLKKDLEQKGIEEAARSMGLESPDGKIALNMLNKPYVISKKGVESPAGPVSEIESLIILNAALSPGNEYVSHEWKQYEKFSGTAGHVDLFKHKVEGTLASLARDIVSNAELIAEKYCAESGAEVGGSDAHFIFQPFPNIKFFIQIYLADEEFPSDARFYFSANADKFMPPLCLEQMAMMWVKQVKGLLS